MPIVSDNLHVTNIWHCTKCAHEWPNHSFDNTICNWCGSNAKIIATQPTVHFPIWEWLKRKKN